MDIEFILDDNTTLPPDYVENIKKEYTGVFYDRFILGKWVLAQGIIYPMYQDAVVQPPDGDIKQFCMSIDYGTKNAFAALVLAKYGDVWYAVDEYYYSGRDIGMTKTDEEYAQDLDKLIEPYGNGRMETIIDPSAASFITLLRKRGGYKVRKADNAVADGIRETATAMKKGLIKISPDCKDLITEMQGYVWDDKSIEDKPVKVADHACDALRYFVKTKQILKQKRMIEKELVFL